MKLSGRIRIQARRWEVRVDQVLVDSSHGVRAQLVRHPRRSLRPAAEFPRSVDRLPRRKPAAKIDPDSPFAKLRELRALVGKSVTITAAGVATRTGILQAVSEDHLTLSVAMGAGNIEYFYDMNSIQKVEAVR